LIGNANTQTSASRRLGRDEVSVITTFLLILVLFASVGHWGVEANVDVTAATAPAWQISKTGTIDLTFLEGTNPWVVPDKNGRPVSDRPPGLIAIAVPAYLATRPASFTNGPGTFTALVTTFAAVVLMFRILRRHFEVRYALATTVLLALGTTTWPTSSSQLWPHGPGQMFAVLAMTALAAERYAGSGLALAGSILVRPVTALVAAVVGVAESWRSRSWRPLVSIGLTSAVGALLLLAYNRWLFGSWNVLGGQSSVFTTGAVDRFTVGSYAGNLFEMFVGWPNGLFLFSPVVLVAAVGATRCWSDIPRWAKSAALAGAAYLLIHAALNRASGGMPVFYRYPLEAITLATPFLAWGGRFLWAKGRVWQLVVLAAGLWSVAMMTIYSYYLPIVISR
jgi:hypothetical protein